MGRTIKNFEVLEQIGQGGTATIYKGIQKSLDRYVVIKELHPHLVTNENFITRFDREAKASALLNHENIVQIIDFGKEDNSFFIALEFIDGGSLKDLKDKTAKFPLEISLFIIAEVAKGLEHAHSKGIVHRDIKPGNVMITSEGKVKLTDFGLAQAKQFTSVTVTGSLIGTPAYMSPEQAAGKKVTQQTDIFSLGVMFYEMAAGVKPFDGENYTSVITKILSYKPKFVYDVNESVPKEINDIIMKTLEKDVEKRYLHVSELLDDIQKFMEKNNLYFTSKDLNKFIKDPDGYTTKLKEKQAKDHIAKGMYYMNIGGEKIEDAITEFEIALRLDPENSEIEGKIDSLKKQRDEIQKRATVPKVKPHTIKPIPKKKKSKAPVFLVLGLIFIVLLITAGILVVVLDPFNLNLLNRPAVPAPAPTPTPGPTPTPTPTPTPPPVVPSNRVAIWIFSTPSGGNIFINERNTNKKTPSKIFIPTDRMVTIKIKKYPDLVGAKRVKFSKADKDSKVRVKLRKR